MDPTPLNQHVNQKNSCLYGQEKQESFAATLGEKRAARIAKRRVLQGANWQHDGPLVSMPTCQGAGGLDTCISETSQLYFTTICYTMKRCDWEWFGMSHADSFEASAI